MSPYKIPRVHRLQEHYYCQGEAISQSHMDNISSVSGFLRRYIFLMNFFRTTAFAGTYTTLVWGPYNTRKTQQHELRNGKVPVLCSAHANGVLGSYFLNDGTIRKVDYYQMLYSYVHSDAQQLPQDPILQQAEVSPTIFASLVLLWMKCFGIDGLEDMVQPACQQYHPT